MMIINANDKTGREVLERLSEQDWVDLYNRLQLFIARRYYGVLRDKDLITRAYLDVMEGRRSWRSDQPVFNNLCLIIKSIASNELSKRKKESSFELIQEADLSTTIPNPPSPAEIFEEQSTRRDLIETLTDAANGDGVLERILDHVIADLKWKPKEIAHALEINVSDVQNARKRLRRKFAVFPENHLRREDYYE